jgi:hypothetical protein
METASDPEKVPMYVEAWGYSCLYFLLQELKLKRQEQQQGSILSSKNAFYA